MRPRFNDADDTGPLTLPLRIDRQAAAGQDGRAKRPPSRLTRSRLARPLLTSLGTITLLAGSSFVVVATSSTGSLQPWDWTRANLSGAAGRYQVCDQQNHGLGAIGCMLSSGFRPASAAGAPATPHKTQPLYSVGTVQDPAPAQAPSAGSKSVSRRGSMPVTRPATVAGAAGSQHLVHFPPNATREEVDSACKAAMQTAMGEGPAVMQEVEDECKPYQQPSPYPSRDD